MRSRKNIQLLSSQEAVISRLKELGTESLEIAEGPITVGDYSDEKLDMLFKIIRGYYITAIQQGYETFPYMRCL